MRGSEFTLCSFPRQEGASLAAQGSCGRQQPCNSEFEQGQLNSWDCLRRKGIYCTRSKRLRADPQLQLQVRAKLLIVHHTAPFVQHTLGYKQLTGSER